MSAREAILSAVHAALGGRTVDACRVTEEARELLGDPAAIRPQLMAPDLVEAFVARATSAKLIGTSVDRIAQVSEFPGAVGRYLTAQGLPAELVLQPSPELQALDWSNFEVRSEMAPDERVGVGVARWAVAETGSLVFHSGEDTPILFNFLPLHHIVLVRASTVLAYLEDYSNAFATTGERQPRNVNIITGASGTTDIEGILVRGAHGPRNLHIVIAK